MKKMLTRSVVFAALSLSSVALAQDEAAAPAATVTKPDAASVKATWDYFYRGQTQGPILVEAKLCTEVAKDGPNKFECTTEVDTAAGLKAGTKGVVLWQAYLAPQNDSYEDIQVQIKQGTTVRETKDVKIKGEGWRARQWTGVNLNKPGSWTVSIIRGDQTLKEIQVKVN